MSSFNPEDDLILKVPFVGRAHELELLHNAMNEGNIVIVRGETMVGKTYLVKHYLESQKLISGERPKPSLFNIRKRRAPVGIYCEMDAYNDSVAKIAGKIALGNNEYQGLVHYLDSASERREFAVQLASLNITKQQPTRVTPERLTASDLKLFETISQLIGTIAQSAEKLVICIDNVDTIAAGPLLQKFIDVVTHPNVKWILVARNPVFPAPVGFFEGETSRVTTIHVDRMTSSEAELLFSQQMANWGCSVHLSSEAMEQVHAKSGDFPYLINFLALVISAYCFNEDPPLVGTAELQQALQKIVEGEFTSVYETSFDFGMQSEDGARCLAKLAEGANVRTWSRQEVSIATDNLPPGLLIQDGDQHFVIAFPQLQYYARLRLGVSLSN